MSEKLLTPDDVRVALTNVINEEITKIPRYDFNRTQFRIEEVQDALNEVYKCFSKLQNTLPQPMKIVVGKKMSSIGDGLSSVEKDLNNIKTKVKEYKKKLYSNPTT